MRNEIEIINRIFTNYFNSSKSNRTDKPEYYVNVLSINEEKSIIFAELEFKTKEIYCCSELTCHFEPEWEKIRNLAKESGALLSKPLSIQFKVRVNEGAIFEEVPTNSKAYEYNEIFNE